MHVYLFFSFWRKKMIVLGLVMKAVKTIFFWKAIRTNNSRSNNSSSSNNKNSNGKTKFRLSALQKCSLMVFLWHFHLVYVLNKIVSDAIKIKHNKPNGKSFWDVCGSGECVAVVATMQTITLSQSCLVCCQISDDREFIISHQVYILSH